ncbi:hypothetical protein Mal15_03770 [Stieleria maiorica]|uniref:Uncharacterized protein n=1 Tax=Stieleria maiorica TaxID=2795974 RepID=A0A5B9M8H1_9BACT|nr:hypothetical protein Mal15_03770 [Stieleria maiorica]
MHARSEGLRRLPCGAQFRRGTACRRRRRCVRGHVRVVQHASTAIIGSAKLRHEGGRSNRSDATTALAIAWAASKGRPDAWRPPVARAESSANMTDYEKPWAGVNVGVRPCGTVAVLSEVGSGQSFAFGTPSSENTATLRTHRQLDAEYAWKDPAKPRAGRRTPVGPLSVSLAHRCAVAPPKADLGNEGLEKLRVSERD